MRSVVSTSDSITRQADVTAYTANDILSDSDSANLTFPIPAPHRGPSFNPQAWLINTRAIGTTNQTTLPSFNLFLFNSSPATIADNAAYTLADSDMANCVGVVSYNTWVIGDDTAAGNIFCIPDLYQPILLTGDTTSVVYGQVKVINAYTPASAEVFTFVLDLAIENEGYA